jgi:membrane protease YdiL (CAAX protease family)
MLKTALLRRWSLLLAALMFAGLLGVRWLALFVAGRGLLAPELAALLANGLLAAAALATLIFFKGWRAAGLYPPPPPRGRTLALFAVPALPVALPLFLGQVRFPGVLPLLPLVATAVLAAFVEEVFFRGMMLRALTSSWRLWPAALVSALCSAVAQALFAAPGASALLSPTPLVLALASAFAFGLMYAALSARAQTILPLIAAHSLSALWVSLSRPLPQSGLLPLPGPLSHPAVVVLLESALFLLSSILLLPHPSGTAVRRAFTVARRPRPGPPTASGAFLRMIVPPIEGEREALAMENWLQACSSDEPFALELCGDRRVQAILLRAASEETLSALSKQIEAQYPQAQLRKIKDVQVRDPLLMRPGEYGLVGEFALREPSWMPIKTFWGREMTDFGTDPLPGMFAAMEPLEEGQRMVCQLALVRAPDHWADRYTRKTVEHPLTEERDKAMAASRATQSGGGTSDGPLILGGLLLLGALARGYLWYRQGAWLPILLLGAGCLLAFIGLLWWWMRRSTPIYDMKLIATKLLRVGFYARVRVFVIARAPAPDPAEQWRLAGMTGRQRARHVKRERAKREATLRAHIDRMEMAYRQFNLASANGFLLRRVRWLEAAAPEAHTLFLPQHAFDYRSVLSRTLHGGAWSRDILNAREASGMVHLPQAEADIPLLKRLPTKHILASAEIAQLMQQAPDALPPVLLGWSEQRGHTVPVLLPEAALFSQKVAVAKSRYGKSTLMQLLTRGAMLPLRGGGLQPAVFIFDPHRDLFEDILHLVPPERAAAVTLIDLSDTERPVGINPLDAGLGFTPDQALANIMNSFSKAWIDFWGPRMAYYLSAVLRTLYVLNMKRCAAGRRDQQYTLLDVNPMLQYPDYARAVISELDPADAQEAELLAWWRDTYFRLNPNSNFKNEVISPILSKMGMFAEKRVLRRIVGQPVSRVDISAALNRGGICLVSLSSKELEDDAVAILGATLVNLLHRAIQAQATLPREQRRRVFLAIDEFQAIPGADYEKLLAEDGKYGGWLMLATQNLKRLNRIRDGLLDIVLANCEQLFAFAVSASDAEVMEAELHKRVSPEHIMSQPRLSCYARLVLPGHPLQISSLRLAEPPSWQRTPEAVRQAETIRDTSRSGYLTAKEVEDNLAQHVQSYLDLDLYTRNLRREVQNAAKARAIREQEKQREEEAQRVRAASQATTPFTSPAQNGNAAPGDPGAATAPTAQTAPQNGSGPQSSGAGDSDQGGGQRRSHSRNHRRNDRRGTGGGGGLPPPTPPPQQPRKKGS